MTQIGDQIASGGQDVLVFSLEMARAELMAKSISRHTLTLALARKWGTACAKTARGVTDGRRYAQYGERAENAEFFLRSSGGYVAVYTGQKEKEPVTVTAIEVSNLRGADRAMLEKGIPVSDKSELLELLEDLGS